MLTKAPVPPPFPITGYDASNKRFWTSDCPNFSTSGSGGVITNGQTCLYPFYIKYDVPANALEMKAYYYANGYSQSGFSNVCHWGMYRVGSSLLDSALVETITASDTSNYLSGSKTQTLTSAYTKGWYVACVVAISGQTYGNTTNVLPQSADVFGYSGTVGSSSIYNKQGAGVACLSGQTSGLPSSLTSASIVFTNQYGIPVWLKY
jgi:hypothetical protein